VDISKKFESTTMRLVHLIVTSFVIYLMMGEVLGRLIKPPKISYIIGKFELN